MKILLIIKDFFISLFSKKRKHSLFTYIKDKLPEDADHNKNISSSLKIEKNKFNFKRWEDKSI